VEVADCEEGSGKPLSSRAVVWLAVKYFAVETRGYGVVPGVELILGVGAE